MMGVEDNLTIDDNTLVLFFQSAIIRVIRVVRVLFFDLALAFNEEIPDRGPE